MVRGTRPHGTNEVVDNGAAESGRWRGPSAWTSRVAASVLVRSSTVLLEISTTPDATRVWAPDGHGMAGVVAALSAGGSRTRPVEGRTGQARSIDLAAGVESLAGLGVLFDAGHTFVWHPSQHPRHRGAQLHGVPIRPR